MVSMIFFLISPVNFYFRQFLKLILTLSMAVMRSDGVYFTQGNAKNAIESLGKYEDVLKGIG